MNIFLDFRKAGIQRGPILRRYGQNRAVFLCIMQLADDGVHRLFQLGVPITEIRKGIFIIIFVPFPIFISMSALRNGVHMGLNAMGKQAGFGFGLWGAVLKATGEVIGQAGLTIQPCEGREVLEIGYLFKKKHWHFGYAREAAEGCKRYAFDILNREKVYSIIKTDNYPSIRVAESIGMKREKEFITRYYGGNMRHYLFSVRKEEKEYV